MSVREDLQQVPSDIGMSMNKILKERFKVVNIVIDTSERDIVNYPNIYDFVVNMAEPFKDVLGIRLLRTELYSSLASETGLPPNAGAYVALNDYKRIYRSREQDNIPLFARIPGGVYDSPALNGCDPLSDPYTHVFRPIEPKLGRFHVRMLRPNGEPLQDNSLTMVLHLALYLAV